MFLGISDGLLQNLAIVSINLASLHMIATMSC